MSRRFQFSLSGLMLVIAMVGVVLALGNWIGFFPAILVLASPFSLGLEWTFVGCKRPTDRPARRSWLYAVIYTMCSAGIAAAAWMSVSSGVPRVMSPFPLLVILPLLEQWPVWTVLGIPVASFAILSVAWPRRPLPLRFLVLLTGATAYSALWLVEGWTYGLKYQGFEFTCSITLINVLFMLVLWSMWWPLRPESNSMWWLIAFNTLLHLWLFWFAFPWLGELI